MNIMKIFVKCLYVTEACILITLAGCTSNNAAKDQPLIKTPNSSNNQDIRKGTENYGLRTLGMDNVHLSKTIAYHPEIAESILSQHLGIQSAYVLLTDVNCYVAIARNGRYTDSKASQEILNRVDEKGAAGFFEEPDMINRVDWISQSGNLPTRSLEAIGRDAAKYMPTNVKRIYVSANPNFLHCLRFYAKEEQLRGDLSIYMNEINMIVERVFPTDE